MTIDRSGDAAPTKRIAIVVMGVSGVGKSAVGERLAVRLGVPFIEGDALHPPNNIEKMVSGAPLDDADRWPWLDAIAHAVNDWPADTLVVTCSALKRAYRRRLSDAASRPLVFLFLDASRETLVHRLAARHGHFMPPGLLDSQLATLERPAVDENAIRISVDPPLETVVDHAASALAKVVQLR
jgi:gluconokinase